MKTKENYLINSELVKEMRNVLGTSLYIIYDTAVFFLKKGKEHNERQENFK